LTHRLADEHDIPTLVTLYDGAARWMLDRGIDQWRANSHPSRAMCTA
jgi:hypothetical protein